MQGIIITIEKEELETIVTKQGKRLYNKTDFLKKTKRRMIQLNVFRNHRSLSEGKSPTIYEQNRAREINITLADKRRNKSIA
ncbi:MAG TPA: hypothetical protein VIJ92_05915 [Ginsengibacter sp.]